MPPWLVSKAAAAAAGGMSISQQQQQQPGFGLDNGIKAESGAFGFKADPGMKLEGIKPEPGFKPDPELKQVSCAAAGATACAPAQRMHTEQGMSSISSAAQLKSCSRPRTDR